MAMGLKAYLTAGGIFVASLGVTVCHAACYAPDQQLPAQTVSDFLQNPNRLLQDPANQNGGEAIANLVRDLLASNPATLAPILGLLKAANSLQQTAIGTGLGGAANLCIRPDPPFAADIQTQLAATDSEFAKTAYAALTGNNPIRGVAGGGGVSGGSSGGSTGGNVGSVGSNTALTQFTSNSTLNSATGYFTGGASSASAPSTTTNVTNITTSVSP